MSDNAVFTANYIMHSLKKHYDIPYFRTCMHECVLSAKKQMEYDIHARDIATGLIDRGFHPPTIYFLLVIKEALMIEPTDTESRERMDSFVKAMITIAETAKRVIF